MKMKKTKILFFTPSFSRGGSEMYLYYLLKTIDTDKFEIFLYSNSEGELTKENLEYPLYVNKPTSSIISLLWKKVLNKVFSYNSKVSSIKKIHKRFKPDLWYINTSVLPEISNLAQKMNVPYVVHFHELESVHDSIIGDDFSQMIEKAKAIIACSSPVKRMINHIRNENVFIQYEHVSIHQKTESSIDIREKYNIPKEAFVWLMSGQKNYRKGYDLIPQIAKFLEQSDAYIIWLGGNRNFGINQLVDSDKHPNFIEPGLLRNEEYQTVLDSVNAFVLTAREDPFPLVMIEAASKGLPIVSFNSGGVSEFVQEGMGKVIPNCDVDMLCSTMEDLMNGTLIYSRENLKSRAKQFDVKVKVKEWEILIDKITEIA